MCKICGCIPFSCRKERRELFHQLKQEFKEYVETLEMTITDNVIEYSVIVPRSFIA